MINYECYLTYIIALCDDKRDPRYCVCEGLRD